MPIATSTQDWQTFPLQPLVTLQRTDFYSWAPTPNTHTLYPTYLPFADSSQQLAKALAHMSLQSSRPA